jgi:hypothetical protein
MLKKNIRTVKTGIILGILLLSLLITFVPTASAGFIEVPPLINVMYPIQDENVVPNSGFMDIPLETSFTLTGPWAEFVEKRSLLRKENLQIELKIIQKPEWCTAKISNPLANFNVGEKEPYSSTLSVAVNENAPAFQQGVVKISATSKELKGLIFDILEEKVEFDISFIIGNLLIISYEMPNGTTAEIGPYDTADFQIDVNNLGNGPTLVKTEIIEGTDRFWDINITSDVALAAGVYEGGETLKPVYFTIKPKKISNWNNERETFKVKFTPQYLGRPDLIGQPEIITFNIQKTGSLNTLDDPGNYFLFIIIIVIILIIVISIVIKRKYLS